VDKSNVAVYPGYTITCNHAQTFEPGGASFVCFSTTSELEMNQKTIIKEKGKRAGKIQKNKSEK
jgi:hypothetical protein